jgi:hypothetical protein
MTGPRLHLDDHGDWDALAVSWTLSALDPEDQARMAAHLQGCQRCSATVRETLRTVTDLAYAAPDEAPPPRLKQQLMAAAAAEPRRPAAPRPEPAADDRPPARVVPRRSRPRRWPTWTAVAAAVALIAALGAWNVQLRSDRDDLHRVVAQREELVQRLTAAGPAQVAIIRRPDGTRDRYATVVVKDGRIGLITERLQPSDDDTDATYWLWSLREPDDPSPVPLAGFRVPGTRFSACNIEPPAGFDPRMFAISAEPGPQRPVKPSHLVGLGTATTG